MPLPTLNAPMLKGSAREEGDAVVISLSGSAELPGQEGLKAFIEAVQAHAKASGAKRVDVELKELKFMASRCFKVFVTWLASLQGLPATGRYRIRFLSNPAQHWQKRSLAALAAFGGDLVEVVG